MSFNYGQKFDTFTLNVKKNIKKISEIENRNTDYLFVFQYG